MDTGINGQNGGFAHMIKRIWNGPEEDNSEEAAAKMQSGRSPEGNPDYARQDEPYERNTQYAEGGNRPFRQEFPKREMKAPENRDYSRNPAPGYNNGKPEYDLNENAENATVISKNTVITGDIKSDSSLEMFGTVVGNITTTGKVRINGKQRGDIQGSSVDLVDCTVRGNVNASDGVTVDSGSVVVGDIKCGDLTFDGKLKGDIHVMGNVSCKGNAIVIGDITSTTMTVESGARLQGNIQVSDGSIDSIDLPDDMKPEEPQK